jgi:hypothetical protein
MPSGETPLPLCFRLAVGSHRFLEHGIRRKGPFGVSPFFVPALDRRSTEAQKERRMAEVLSSAFVFQFCVAFGTPDVALN